MNFSDMFSTDNLVKYNADNNVINGLLPNTNIGIEDGYSMINPLANTGEINIGALNNNNNNKSWWDSFSDTMFTPEGLKAGAGALQTIGSLWLGFQQNKRAKKQMQIAIDQWNKQWNAQTKAYNTRLANKTASNTAGMSNAQLKQFNNEYGSAKEYNKQNMLS